MSGDSGLLSQGPLMLPLSIVSEPGVEVAVPAFSPETVLDCLFHYQHN